MRSGDFDLRDLIEKLPAVDAAEDDAHAVFGIYIYYFEDVNHPSINGFSDRRDALPSGESIDIPAGEKQHKLR